MVTQDPDAMKALAEAIVSSRDDSGHGVPVRPDTQTKAVNAIGFAIIMGVLVWIGTTTVDLRDRTTRVETRLDSFMDRATEWHSEDQRNDEEFRTWLRRLRDDVTDLMNGRKPPKEE